MKSLCVNDPRLKAWVGNAALERPIEQGSGSDEQKRVAALL